MCVCVTQGMYCSACGQVSGVPEKVSDPHVTGVVRCCEPSKVGSEKQPKFSASAANAINHRGISLGPCT